MKKVLIVCCLLISVHSHAQIPIVSIITAVVKKVVQALDLEVQKLQTQTIWLQNAQKTLENAMSEWQLNGITGWVQQTKDLYQEYYAELWQVKEVIADYDRVKQLIQRQGQIVKEYQQAFAQFRKDTHFTAQEIAYMSQVYSGILDQSLKNVQQVLLVVNAFVTQMSDGQRMNIINNASKAMEKNYNDLRQFNQQAVQLSLERANESGEVESVKSLYGLK